MDLTSLLNNLKKKKYQCYKEFFNDYLLIFKNCIQYVNDGTSEYYIRAKDYLGRARKFWKQFYKSIRNDLDIVEGVESEILTKEKNPERKCNFTIKCYRKSTNKDQKR